MNTIEAIAQGMVDKYKEYVYCFMGSGMLVNHPDENVVLWNAKNCAIIELASMIAENHSILSMLKIHSDARARLAIHVRLEELQKIKEAINQL